VPSPTSDSTPLASLAIHDLAQVNQRKINQQWQIGDVTITKIVELESTHDLSGLIPGATPEKLRELEWLRPHFANEKGLAKSSIHALIIDTPSKRLIVDTCLGNDKDRATLSEFHQLQLPFLNDLNSAGFPRESFDVVLCTHLHLDHVGWNTMLVDGCWEPTFPNARYLFGRVEYDYWKSPTVSSIPGWAELQQAVFVDSVKPVVDAGLADFVDSAYQVCAEVSLVPTIGHSPGHVSVRIVSKGEEALITGDMAHHPCQLAHLNWSTVFDYDPAQASRTRADTFARIAGKEVLVIGTHWAGATAGRIINEGEAYRLSV
jgi:glyoxylase-like metal-dependent hydrolase (beta-lactamase superfamily II)